MMKHIRRRALRQFVHMRRFVMVNLLHANDPPHRLALGVAIGVFWTFTPFIGIQMVAVVATAWLLRANKIVGVPLVWISNPATFVPIFYPCYAIGRAVLGWEPVGRQWWSELTKPPEGGFFPVTEFYWGRVMEIFSPLMLGCLLVAIPLAIAGYLLTFSAVARYRARAPQGHHRLPRRRRLATAPAGENG